jgi:imidazolonepropionase-like amidohydrolase
MKTLLIISLIIILGLTSCQAASPKPTEAANLAGAYLVTDVTIIDVAKGLAIPDQTITVVGDQIEAIVAQAGTGAVESAEVIDGSGLYVIPGLVDAHIHYYDAPVFGRVLIAKGVLLARDMGMPNEYILSLRDELNQGTKLGPEMVAAGAMLDGSPPVIPSISLAVQTPEQGRLAVQNQAAAGVDMIKVYSKLSQEVFLAILEEAKKSGLKVVGHVPDSTYIEDAASAGLSSIEHWFGFEKVIAKLLGEPVKLTYTGIGAGYDNLLRLGEVDPQALQDFYLRLRDSGVTVDPTVVTFKNWPNVDTLEASDLPGGEYISQDLLSMWKTQWPGQTEFPDLFWQNWAQMVKGMNEAGVPLMVGTDLMCPGLVPGFSVHEEMAIWQEAGIPQADILRSATLVPAQFMGLGDRLGSLSVGKTASFVLLRANPLEDIHNAEQIEGVFLRGQYFDRQALDQLLKEAEDLAKQPAP